MFEYRIVKKSKGSKARIGIFSTPHGLIETPVFMPVGTVGAVKTMSREDLTELKSQIILANTYHLYLRPGDKLIKKAGGIHEFIRWNKPILTDSGGFQVFSLAKEESHKSKDRKRVKPAQISNHGVKFFSHLDGSSHFFTAEKSIKIQENLGADIIMAFDECPDAGLNGKALDKAIERTHSWLMRCIKVKTRSDQALFPICQGGTNKALRIKSAYFINKLNLPGNAIGGVSVGEPKAKIYQVANWCTNILSPKKPRYLMGIGYPEDIIKVISLGIDMFDCVLPTRLARHGVVWVKTKTGPFIKLPGLKYGYKQINLKNSKYKNNFNPIDSKCSCLACRNSYSLSYLRHLISEYEPLGIHLLTYHNLRFVYDLISDVKREIASGRF